MLESVLLGAYYDVHSLSNRNMLELYPLVMLLKFSTGRVLQSNAYACDHTTRNFHLHIFMIKFFMK